MINKIIKIISNIFGSNKIIESRTLSFNKERLDGCWYINYPKWKGPHHNLMMVAGADLLLDYLEKKFASSYCKDKLPSWMEAMVRINVTKSNEPLEDRDNDIKLEKIEDDNYGATYKVSNCPGFDHTVWLCPVTLFVIGEYPKYFYIKQ